MHKATGLTIPFRVEGGVLVFDAVFHQPTEKDKKLLMAVREKAKRLGANTTERARRNENDGTAG